MMEQKHDERKKSYTHTNEMRENITRLNEQKKHRYEKGATAGTSMGGGKERELFARAARELKR